MLQDHLDRIPSFSSRFQRVCPYVQGCMLLDKLTFKLRHTKYIEVLLCKVNIDLFIIYIYCKCKPNVLLICL